MDIITHVFSGIAAGTVVSGFSGKGFREKIKVTLFAGLGGALPDIDTISLWSGFDNTFGKIFALPYPGKIIYFSKFWYSHHGFFHSLLAGLFATIFIGALFHLSKSILRRKNEMGFPYSLYHNRLILTGFIAGYIIHLLGDMFTPGSVWGGVRLLWPLKLYVGGTGEIWWWNNYDIFLIFFGLTIINGLLLFFQNILKIDVRKLLITFFLTGFILCIVQIKTRGYDFEYVGQTVNFREYEQKSKDLQEKILGRNLYQVMVKLDNRLKLNF